MIEIQTYNPEGQAGDKVAVDDATLGGEVNMPVLRQLARFYDHAQRVGTRHVKTRGEVVATTKKLYRQKHTGNARAGSKASGTRRGGGKAHAPQAQDWSQRASKKTRRLAMRSALLARLKDDEVSLLESLALEAPKTQTVAKLLKEIGVIGSCLLVIDGEPEAVRIIWRSARNIVGVRVRRVNDVNAHDLLASDRVVFTRSAFDAFMKAHTS